MVGPCSACRTGGDVTAVPCVPQLAPRTIAGAGDDSLAGVSLADCGLDVSGDPAVSFTETHQVLLDVGYTRGPEIARRLEENNILVNYQASPDEEGFTASGSLRMGVSEMTRFGMGPEDFAELAELIHDVIEDESTVQPRVSTLRKRFLDMQYCFAQSEYESRLGDLHKLV
jgi:aminomethyltransferase